MLVAVSFQFFIIDIIYTYLKIKKNHSKLTLKFPHLTFWIELVYLSEVKIQIGKERDSGSDADWFMTIFPMGKDNSTQCRTNMLE